MSFGAQLQEAQRIFNYLEKSQKNEEKILKESSCESQKEYYVLNLK